MSIKHIMIKCMEVGVKQFVRIYCSSLRLKAWDELQAYQGIITYNVDDKAELAEARNEKHACFPANSSIPTSEPIALNSIFID